MVWTVCDVVWTVCDVVWTVADHDESSGVASETLTIFLMAALECSAAVAISSRDSAETRQTCNHA